MLFLYENLVSNWEWSSRLYLQLMGSVHLSSVISVYLFFFDWSRPKKRALAILLIVLWILKSWLHIDAVESLYHNSFVWPVEWFYKWTVCIYKITDILELLLVSLTVLKSSFLAIFLKSIISAVEKNRTLFSCCLSFSFHSKLIFYCYIKWASIWWPKN